MGTLLPWISTVLSGFFSVFFLQTVTQLGKRNKNILSLKSNNIEDLKSENQKLKEQLENLSNKDTITNIDVIGGVNSKYTEGVYIDSFEGQYGTILKFSINLKRFSQNNKVTPKGYVYFEVKKAQSGKYYATPQKYFN